MTIRFFGTTSHPTTGVLLEASYHIKRVHLMIWNTAANMIPKVGIKRYLFGFLTTAGLTLTSVLGCSKEYGEKRPPSQPVKGQVLLNGKPLTSGVVVLVSPKYSSEYSGQIGSDGRFTIKSGSVEGAPEGEYRVRIEPEPQKGQSSRPKKGATNLPYPGRYADETTSDLNVTVKSGENDLDLKLTKTAASSK